MIEIRIHGRGGQGNVVASYLLAITAFEGGRYSQAFPSFGAERRGAPVTAFVRMADKPFRRRCQIRQPWFLIIQDQALLRVPGVLDGLRGGGGILVNSNLESDELSRQVGREVVSVPAASMAQEILGRPVPNTALLAAFLTLTGLLPVDALNKALAQRFKGEVLERNQRLVEEARHKVPQGRWQEVIHEAGA